MSRRNRHRKVTRIQSEYVQKQEQNLERQSREKKFLYRRLIAFGVLFTIALSSMFLYHLNQRAQLSEKQEEYAEKEEQLAEYQEENEELNREIELLSDVEYLLQIARKDYFFSKDGEIIFKLPDEEPSY
ncbi:cell division protein [Halalkalibacillus sediminis]|uniref:Cell division protein n=1 Tax=Halalkalibacillus sediminis TaxID=2018042 RepID=A0A2I0QT41_9BACI|nr:septum formation initiator family protein [Halalkalibacillus sediminis]PKR77511.1 cell division protein [Halalkalibacillus sediminis]